MRKLLAICLMLMLVTASASAAEWGEGLSPSRPYPNVHERNLDEEIGYIMFHPNKLMSTAGTKLLFIYLPREDVRAGNGQITLISDDQGEEWSVALNDTTYVNVRPMTEVEMEGLIWGSGTCFEIMLPVSLRLGHTYSVDMDEQCIVANVGTGIGNLAAKGVTNAWSFETIGDYGVSEMVYQSALGDGTFENKDGLANAGDKLRFDLVLGGKAKAATLFVLDNGAISFDNGNYFTESCEVTGDVFADDPGWGVIFWDVADPSVYGQDEQGQHMVDILQF